MLEKQVTRCVQRLLVRQRMKSIEKGPWGKKEEREDAQKIKNGTE
jgi:hypothetical protein